MTASIDYSRPVGWWCPVCCTADGYVGRLIRRKPRERKQKHYCLDDEGNRLRKTPIASCIPRYLPIPKGQRPLVDDEVDSEEAEVSSWIVDWEEKTYICYTGNYHDHIQPYTTSVDKEPTAEEIRFIVTGATE